MEDWLKKATVSFPELAKYYVNPDNLNEVYVENAHELWIDLEEWFYVSVKEGNADFQARVLEYFRFCVSGKVGGAGSQIQQAARICMLYDIGLHPEYWANIPSWFSRREFQRYKEEMCFYLSSEKAKALVTVYEENSK